MREERTSSINHSHHHYSLNYSQRLIPTHMDRSHLSHLSSLTHYGPKHQPYEQDRVRSSHEHWELEDNPSSSEDDEFFYPEDE